MVDIITRIADDRLHIDVLNKGVSVPISANADELDVALQLLVEMLSPVTKAELSLAVFKALTKGDDSR